MPITRALVIAALFVAVCHAQTSQPCTRERIGGGSQWVTWSKVDAQQKKWLCGWVFYDPMPGKGWTAGMATTPNRNFTTAAAAEAWVVSQGLSGAVVSSDFKTTITAAH